MGTYRADQLTGVIDDDAAPARGGQRGIEGRAQRSARSGHCAPALQVSLGDAAIQSGRLDPAERLMVLGDDERPLAGTVRRVAQEDRPLGLQRQSRCGVEGQCAIATVPTDEVGDEVIRRMGEEVCGTRDLREPSPDAQHRDLVTELDRLVDVVGDEDDRLP